MLHCWEQESRVHAVSSSPIYYNSPNKWSAGVVEGEIMHTNNFNDNIVCQARGDNTIIITIISIANNYWALTLCQTLCQMFLHTQYTYLPNGTYEVSFNLDTSLSPSNTVCQKLNNIRYGSFPGHFQLLKQSQSRLQFGSSLNLPASLMAPRFPSAIPMRTSCAWLYGLPLKLLNILLSLFEQAGNLTTNLPWLEEDGQ